MIFLTDIAIILQSGQQGSRTGLILCLSILVILTILFFYFLKRTDKIVEERERQLKEQILAKTVIIRDDPSEEAAAAIALAISMYKIQADEQNNLTVTIQKVSKMYSPWSSKIYTLRQLPR